MAVSPSQGGLQTPWGPQDSSKNLEVAGLCSWVDPYTISAMLWWVALPEVPITGAAFSSLGVGARTTGFRHACPGGWTDDRAVTLILRGHIFGILCAELGAWA